LGDYLRRRRLEVAAMRLAAQPRVPVLNIALSVGFGSSEAFARAFRARFGCTASAWRKSEAKRRVHERLGADQAPERERNPNQAQRNQDQTDSKRNQDE